MSPKAAIAAREGELAIVRAILGAQLPPGALVWVFGSRATGRAKRFSDLDLAIDAGRPLRLDEQAALAEAFSESDLPWKVDVVDWPAATEGFRAAVAGQIVALEEWAAAITPHGAAAPPPRPAAGNSRPRG